MGLLPLATVGRDARLSREPAWYHQDFATGQYERARKAATRLIHADPDDVALISSVGYGVATAAKQLPTPHGSRVLVLQDDHSSPVLEWMARAGDGGFTVETVQPVDGDWTQGLMAAIERPGAASISVVSISSVHWSDGGSIDLDRVAPAVRSRGAALLVDATHSVGVADLDVRALDPDFLVFPTYKWLLGPYGRAFLYVARRHQDGIPPSNQPRPAAVRAEQTSISRYQLRRPARRFDMGERAFISMEMASIGMELVAEWGSATIVERLAMLTGRLADGLHSNAVTLPDARVRAPHILSLGFDDGMPQGLTARLAAESVHVATRLGRMRISPHVYNDESDVDRFLATFHRLMPR